MEYARRPMPDDRVATVIPILFGRARVTITHVDDDGVGYENLW